MSQMLEQAIVDAEALKEAALKNAEQAIVEKYSKEVKDAVEVLLEQEPPPMDPAAAPMPPEMGMMPPPPAPPSEMVDDVPLAATEGEELCPCPEKDEKVEISFSQLRKMAGQDQMEAGGPPLGAPMPPEMMGGMPPEEEAMMMMEHKLADDELFLVFEDCPLMGPEPEEYDDDEDDEDDEEYDDDEEDENTIEIEDVDPEDLASLAMAAVHSLAVQAGAEGLSTTVEMGDDDDDDDDDYNDMDFEPTGDDDNPFDNTATADDDEEDDDDDDDDDVLGEDDDEMQLNESDLAEILEALAVDMHNVPTGQPGGGSNHALDEENLDILNAQLANESETTPSNLTPGVGANLEAQITKENSDLKESLQRYDDHFKTLNEKNKHYESLLVKLKNRLEEVNLTNAKLLYTNRTLNSDSLNERQRNKIADAISKVQSVEEAKVVYETLQSTVRSTKKTRGPESLSEVVRRPSTILPRKQTVAKPSDPISDRWKILAGIK
jgi:hypothetical protein